MHNLNYGIIGNCSSGALVSEQGCIEFLCLPNFQSSSVFAKLLDKNIGGHFGILVNKGYKITQKYIESTTILKTSFSDGTNAFDVFDYMPRYLLEGGNVYHPPELIRFFRHISGKPTFTLDYCPKLSYAKGVTHHELTKTYIKSTSHSGEYESLYLYSNFSLTAIHKKEEITLTENKYCCLNYNQKIIDLSADYIHLQYIRTKTYWIDWCSKIHKIREHEVTLRRSLMTLKLLTYEKTGAMIAALTTSLPETIGEQRNWDYRYCWVRDAALTASVFNRLGHEYVAKNFVNFIISVTPFKKEAIQIMYDITGNKSLDEFTLDHLSGYENSAPVRIGNAAYSQRQLDIYGFLLDIIDTSINDYVTNLNEAEHLWTMVRNVVRHVENDWQKTDSGLWEFRDSKQHFVFSKICCWVAIDRAIKIAKKCKQRGPIKQWKALADTIKADVFENGWSTKHGAFMQAYDSEYYDAANLLMEPYGFIEATDPKFIATVKQTHDALCKDGLMLRYNCPDDFGKPKSSFIVCTFWMIDALQKIGETTLAKTYYDQLLGYRNHLGLLSEDICFNTKRLLGNFPQAYSHLALIVSTLNLADTEPYNPNLLLENIKIE
tara:strand:+ start:209 stop:2020 length:1812 start_codon:yes stop_codon:yes gene_type:complete